MIYKRYRPPLTPIIKEVKAASYLTVSRLPEADFVINPYIGCTHACKYCYAAYMRRFTGHAEDRWGDFLDVKIADKPLDAARLNGKRILIASVTDAYNPAEKDYALTRNLLTQLAPVDAQITLLTKSALVLRDIDILKSLKNVTVALSVNTLDERFRADMDRASTIAERLNALKILHENSVSTALFMSPIFPEITNWKDIISASRAFVPQFWFENLNLRDEYKKVVLDYIDANYPHLHDLYYEIYVRNSKAYLAKLSLEIMDFCNANKIKFRNYFFHEDIRKQ